jgi:hypothetical protein
MTKIDLINAILARRPVWMNRTDFPDAFASSYPLTLADLEIDLDNENDPFILGSTMTEEAAPEITDEIINTTIADTALLELIASARKIHGDTILVYNVSEDEFVIVPRKSFDELIIAGDDATPFAFEEISGALQFYIKQDEFTLPAEVHYRYKRKLSTDLSTDETILDFRPKDTAFVIQRTIEYINQFLESNS